MNNKDYIRAQILNNNSNINSVTPSNGSIQFSLNKKGGNDFKNNTTPINQDTLLIKDNTLTIGSNSIRNDSNNKNGLRINNRRYQLNTSGIKSKFQTNKRSNITNQKITDNTTEKFMSSNIGFNVTKNINNLTKVPQDGYNAVKIKKKSYPFELYFHDNRSSKEPFLIDISQLPGAKEGDLAELKTYHSNLLSNQPSSTSVSGNFKPRKMHHKVEDKKLYFIVKDFNNNGTATNERKNSVHGINIKSNNSINNTTVTGNNSISLNRRTNNPAVSIATGELQKKLDLPIKSRVWIKLKNKETTQADLIELNVKDCLVNRGDMWLISNSMVDTCVYSGQKLTFIDSLRLAATGIYKNGKKILSGYVGDKTKIIIRSESAKFTFIIQITEEMWHFEQNGEIVFHQVVNSLFPMIFKKWKKIDTHHSITIILSANVDLSNTDFRSLKPGERQKNSKDYYRIVADQVSIAHWDKIMETLRIEFMRFSKDLLNVVKPDGTSKIQGRLSQTVKTNILESVNLASCLLLDPFRQIDLRHTTTHLIIISPGTGLFDVDYDLLQLTSKKLLSLEFTMDIICLTQPPLHIVPLFRYLDYSGELHHCIPIWLSISFWSEVLKKYGKWHPRCKIYDIQMMGVTENELKEEITISPLVPFSSVKSLNEFIHQYEKNVFTDHLCLDKKNRNTSFSSDFLETFNNTHRIKEATTNGGCNFLWREPKSSAPVLNEVDTSQIFADIHTVNEAQYEDTDTRLKPKISKDCPSLATDSLKSAYKNQSYMTSLTHKVASKILPEFFYPTNTTKNLPEKLIKGTDNLSLNVHKDSLGEYDNNRESLKKNFSSFSGRSLLHDAESVAESGASRSNSLIQDKLTVTKNQKRVRKITENDTCIEIDNASIPFDEELAVSLIPARWKDVYPKFVPKSYSKWKSFSTPADLPVTTSLMPTTSEFEELYELRNHSVTLNPDQEILTPTPLELLKKMIYVRILCGFQVCKGIKTLKIEALQDLANPNVSAVLNDDDYIGKKFYLLLEDEIHRLCCDDTGVINIQRYIRKKTLNTLDRLGSYTSMIKTRYENSYRAISIDPINSKREKMNWNQVDQILAGYEDSVLDKNKKMFRSKFVILPASVPANTFGISSNAKNEKLTEEELRLEGLTKLIAAIHRSRLRSDEERKNKNLRKEEILPEIYFYTGPLFQFISGQAELFKNNMKDLIVYDDSDSFNKNTSIDVISYELQHGKDHLTMVNRIWHWKKHKNCFVGSALVNWLLEHFTDIETREEAVLYGQELMNKGLFVHVLDRHGFLDGHYFYQISPSFVCDARDDTITTATTTTNTTTTTANNNNNNNADSPLTLSQHSLTRNRDRSISMKSVNSSKFTAALNIMTSIKSPRYHNSDETILSPDINEDIITPEPKPNIVLSSSVYLDLDPSGQSSKKEICTVHFDRVHNPEHCYHIRLEWLTVSPKLIDNLINSWSRLCERYGLKLVEIPWIELCAIPSQNPFHSFVDIKLALNPWFDEHFNKDAILSENKFYYHIYLLGISGFLLDNRASAFFHDNAPYEIMYSWGKPQFRLAQYVHNTGAYIAEIRENGDLFLAPNNIHLSRVNVNNSIGNFQGSTSSAKYFIDSQKIMLDFKKTCLNYDKLLQIFTDAKKQLANQQEL
ncbi:related to Vacuolar membrane-associated protein IML1 [Saccharomycodes ludwigii]|uniref:Vacuolar membrane-associated protein IML1 n=1 Tax=Saccharomycodes ludwigii TaxID=36035 RepID=A0A376B1T5_9ASCO|nr:related to Vacuolar membrane-associated protein IML1 [Saccharomycodes ludwigii]